MRAFICLSALLLAAPVFAQDSLTLNLKYPLVEKGEVVSMEIRNDSNADVTLFPGIEVFRGNTTVYFPTTAFLVPQTLKKGHSVTWDWGQQTLPGQTITPGTYRIVVTGMRQDNLKFSLSAEFEIVAKTNGTVVFNTNKTLYKKGEKVLLYIINKGLTPVILTNGAPWVIYRHNWWGGHDYVFAPITFQMVFPVNPGGDRRMWDWDQRNIHGKQVMPGTFHVTLKAGVSGAQKAFVRHFKVGAQ